jgi:tRNA1Val (adenine37-N6)-methyltransferase
MPQIFRFKQFSVDQTGCAMKINTDGVLLGAMAAASCPGKILDIGTGTGVIALMLAQRYANAVIDAVEIDESAAKTAVENFSKSPFHSRLTVFPASIDSFFDTHPGARYDLIVSNPPFYINSLESPKANKNLAKHASADFFEVLIHRVTAHLTRHGLCWLVLPLQTAALIKDLADKNGLHLHQTISVHSFEGSEPHREIVCFGFTNRLAENTKFAIYQTINYYTDKYKTLLQPFFVAF